MVKATCVTKNRDKNNKIISYVISINNNFTEVGADELKNGIKRGQIIVDNLTLTSDNRLVSTEIKLGNNIDLKQFREKHKSNTIYARYQGIFDTIGVDVLSAAYLSLPKEGDTIYTILDRTFMHKKLNKSAKDIIQDPSCLIGVFEDYESTSYDPNTINNESSTVLAGRDSKMRVPLLLLHSNGELRLVLICELSYKYSTTSTLREAVNIDAKSSLAIITLDNNLKAVATRVGKHISNREKYIMAKRIAASNIKYWAGTDATKSIISNLEKEDARVKLKSAGITSLSIPFGALLLVGAIGGTLVGALLEGFVDNIQCKTPEEFIAFQAGGTLARDAVRRAQNNNN